MPLQTLTQTPTQLKRLSDGYHRRGGGREGNLGGFIFSSVTESISFLLQMCSSELETVTRRVQAAGFVCHQAMRLQARAVSSTIEINGPDCLR